MIILIPIGGKGGRFKKEGYTIPKALIEVLGKPILYYLLDNLNNLLDCSNYFIYIPYNKEYTKYNLEDRLKKDYPNYKFIFLELKENTKGAVETIYIALNKLKETMKQVLDESVLCLDVDNFYMIDIISKWQNKNVVFTFNDKIEDAKFSYVITKDDILIDIVEKIKISDNACTGAYGFNLCNTLIDYCGTVIKQNILQKGEYYISSVIKLMIKVIIL